MPRDLVHELLRPRPDRHDRLAAGLDLRAARVRDHRRYQAQAARGAQDGQQLVLTVDLGKERRKIELIQ